MLKLKVIKGGKGSQPELRLHSGQRLIVGRSQESDLRLVSGGVSKRHVAITALPGARVEVEDLQSSNGTYVNGLLVRKHLAKVGDVISLHSYALQIERDSEAHTAQSISFDNNYAPGIEAAGSENGGANGLGQKAVVFTEANVYPWADRISSSLDLRLLFIATFILWSLSIIFLTASPFMSRANERVIQQSAAVASLYARQLARLNQQAIVDQRYSDLISSLDARIGDTRGLIAAYIVDTVNNQILAPTSQLGGSLPHREAVLAARRDQEHIQIVKKGGMDIVYASAPIKIGTSEGNQMVATALVEFNATGGQFNIASLMDQVINSMFFVILISGVFFLFIYRWIEGSLVRLSKTIEQALERGTHEVSIDVRWPTLKVLADQISSSLAKSTRAGQSIGGSSHQVSMRDKGHWAVAATEIATCAAASLDSQLVVSSWNDKMAALIGIRANMAIGQEISAASRDISFESAVRELAEECHLLEWTKLSRDLEFGGNPFKLVMIFGDASFWINIVPVEEVYS